MKIKDQVVINSINNDDNNLCIDFFIRNNNTFGYQEYRKDPENISGWYRIGNYDHKIFLSETMHIKMQRIQLFGLNKK